MLALGGKAHGCNESVSQCCVSSGIAGEKRELSLHKISSSSSVTRSWSGEGGMESGGWVMGGWDCGSGCWELGIGVLRVMKGEDWGVDG